MTKIMLVEDDKSLREIYGVRLQAEGYEIKSAGDGEEALAMAIKERPDLILADVMMPKISGFDMLDILRATPETKDIKVIMMTALSSEDQRARGETLGANRYLVKSQVGIEDVVRTIHDVLIDAPVAATPAPTQFAAPAPAQPAPMPTIPQQPIAPVAESVMPLEPVSEPIMATEPIDQPAPMPEPVMQPTMPQPTAPFSTPAPDSMVNSMNEPIQPIMAETPAMPPQPTIDYNQTPEPAITPVPDVATMINQELSGEQSQPPVAQ
ncbi:MAG: response regulator [Candidatus Saccharibacteria bacterium]